MYKRLVILGLVAGIGSITPLSWGQAASAKSKVSNPEMPEVQESSKGGQKQAGKLAGDKNFVLMVDETHGEFNFGFGENNEAESIQAKRSELVAVIDDLQSRPSSGNAQVDRINADLCVDAIHGLGHIDQMLRLLEVMQPDTAIKDPPG